MPDVLSRLSGTSIRRPATWEAGFRAGRASVLALVRREIKNQIRWLEGNKATYAFGSSGSEQLACAIGNLRSLLLHRMPGSPPATRRNPGCPEHAHHAWVRVESAEIDGARLSDAPLSALWCAQCGTLKTKADGRGWRFHAPGAEETD